MSNSLPATVDPFRLCAEGVRLAGRLSAKPLQRLAALCADAPGDIDIDLHFGKNPQGWCEMHGRIGAHVRVACQRCLGAMPLEVKVEPALLFVRPADEARLPDEVDRLVVDKPMSLKELVEEELVLAMPMVPVHAAGECQAQNYPRENRGASPFDALRALRPKDK